MTYHPDKTTVRDGFMQAIDKTYDEAYEISRLLREFLPVKESVSDLEMVKLLISMYRDLTDKHKEREQLTQARIETLRDRLAQAALTGLLAAGNEDACGLAYQYADTALRYRNESEDK